MKITRKQLRQWDACYDDVRIAELVPEAGLTPLEVAALDIPAEDRLWVLLHEEVIPARELRLLACDWAETACHAAGWADERSPTAIAVARRFACGDATEAELDAAETEARAAARTAWAARPALAAWSAAWSAACSASREADQSASAAAAAAAEAAARSARSAAEAAAEAVIEGQLADVVKVLRG